MILPRLPPQPKPVIRTAMWLADRRDEKFGPIEPLLNKQLDLSAVQAADACTLATQLRMVRRAFR